MLISKTLYCFLILFSLSASAYDEKCRTSFTKFIQQEIPLKFISTHTTQKPVAKKTSSAKARPPTRKQITQNFLESFHARDTTQIKELVLKHPFLKKVRFPIDQSSIQKEHQHWMPEGWTPPQMASYLKDLELLSLFLELDFNLRTKKKTGGVSVEDNPLHIAIKRNFLEGAKSILNHVGPVRFGIRNRFIDEKTHDKYTTWALTIQHYQKYRELNFINLVGKYQPSGYTESYDKDIPKDGYKLANETGSSEVIDLASRYLIAPKYEHYREIKQKYPNPFYKRTKPSFYH